MAQIAQVSGRRLQVTETSKRCTVPNDPIARLMYYLNCVECVSCGSFPSYMTNYANYRQLSPAQRSNIIGTARRNDPDEVLCFVEADELPDNDANKFLQLSAQEESLTAFGIRGGGQAMMGLRRQLGNRQNLIKIMVHTDSWAHNNYYQPLRQLTTGGSDAASAALGMIMLLRALQMD
ncbi:hypothetical protein BOX15_Mlig025960g1 [Macrostomum lignano]|uniref:Uncharacterized protein n=1 Tax=Macrostomum lignano TaxID=282301 RepID=A0A267EX23_9PLAT|nr:hypothetical protein BOX15_Mlig025960g1 [Macrostomum lignano]